MVKENSVEEMQAMRHCVRFLKTWARLPVLFWSQPLRFTVQMLAIRGLSFVRVLLLSTSVMTTSLIMRTNASGLKLQAAMSLTAEWLASSVCHEHLATLLTNRILS